MRKLIVYSKYIFNCQWPEIWEQQQKKKEKKTSIWKKIAQNKKQNYADNFSVPDTKSYQSTK